MDHGRRKAAPGDLRQMLREAVRAELEADLGRLGEAPRGRSAAAALRASLSPPPASSGASTVFGSALRLERITAIWLTLRT